MKEYVVSYENRYFEDVIVGELIRCKDCRWYVHSEGVCKLYSNNYDPSVKMETDDYCSKAKRKEE